MDSYRKHFVTRANRRAAALAICLLAAAGLAQAQAKVPVVIAVGAQVLDVSQANNTSIPIFTKCWENAGLDVTIQPTNSTAAMQAVLSGKADFVNMGPAAGFLARAKGAPLTAVYLNMRKQFAFPVVLDSSPIKSIKDFKGKTMGVASYGAQMVEIFKGQMLEAGLDPKSDVTIVETGVGAQAVAALQSGRVDVWGTWDSQIATAEAMGIKLRRFTSPFAEKLSMGGSYFVRDDYIAKNPQVIEKVLNCVAQGSAFVLANPDAAVKVHWRVYPNTKPSGVDEATAFRQARHILGTRAEFLKLEPGVTWGEIPRSAVVNMLDFMKQTGSLTVDLKPEDTYTNRFVPAYSKFDPAQVAAQANAVR